jgi:hypothetical protein
MIQPLQSIYIYLLLSNDSAILKMITSQWTASLGENSESPDELNESLKIIERHKIMKFTLLARSMRP